MDNCHSIGTPLATKPKLDVDLSGEPLDQSDYRSKIGSLTYLTSRRPYLVQAVCYCARYQARPTQKHLKEVKRIFKYLKGTINMGLWYPKDSGFELTAFSDADHAGCLDTRKSTSGGIQFLGDKLVSWMSKKQNCTAMSSAEAEYVALSASCAQVMWMRTQLQDYGFNYNKIPLYCDSQSAIAISCKAVHHSHTKHIHTRPFREDKCLIRRENQCFIVLLSGALFQPHRRRDILSFMSITKRVFKGVEIFDQRGTYWYRYSNPMIQPEPEGSTQGYPLVSVEVLSIKVKEFQRSFRHSDTERLSRSDEVLKLKNFKKDATLKLSKSTNQERYEHVGPEVASSQDGKVSRWRRDYDWQSMEWKLRLSHSGRSLKIVMENPNHLNEPNKAIPKVNLVVPEPNQVADIHDTNKMVDIPDDIELVDYDDEDPKEDSEEELEPNNRHGNQFAQHPNPQQPDEDVEIKVDDNAELIFPYEVEGDQTPPPRDESSDSEPPNTEL
ncbi:hypothetical protein Tco_0200869, partial [Tanacetum coccineum]